LKVEENKRDIMRKTSLLIIFLLLFACSSNEGNEEKNELLKEYIYLIEEKCDSPKIVDVEREEGGFVNVDFLCNGTFVEAGVHNHSIEYLETKALPNEIPMKDIEKKLKKKYKQWYVEKISIVELKEERFIKVELISGGKVKNVFFTEKGDWFSVKKIMKMNKWFIRKLTENVSNSHCKYNLLKPSKVYELPEMLLEISGVDIANENTIVCVQDELGALFEYRTDIETLGTVYRFARFGDFEDIALAGDTAYVLRSDGTIFYFNYKELSEAETMTVPLDAYDIESLFYNTHSRFFYIVSKDKNLHLDGDDRMVYRFKKEAPHDIKPYIHIDSYEMNEFYQSVLQEERNGEITFNPSAMAIHPITGETYVLSAHDRYLAIYNNDRLVGLYKLPEEIYNKPEGINFYKNGDMIISNEGDKSKGLPGNICYFRYE